MDIRLYIRPNINGKLVEKRLYEIIHEYNINATVKIHYETAPKQLGIFFTPTLIINGKVVSNGRVLSKEDIEFIFHMNCFKTQ